MRFAYCPHCGTKAILKEIGDEGLMPYCDQCQIPLWDMSQNPIKIDSAGADGDKGGKRGGLAAEI